MVKCCCSVFRYLTIMMLVFPMTACNVVTEWMDKLGFDTYDYMQEAVTGTCDTTGETAQMLMEMLEILTASSANLSEFTNMSQAINAYRDSVLTYMLRTEYARYSGNQTLITEAIKEYPEYQITQIIPAREFEATMYRYFGGSVKISHKNGQVFRYLSKVNAYISSVTPVAGECEIILNTIEETEKTYRVYFAVDSGGDVVQEYFALVIKREDGTHYFKQLSKYIPAAVLSEE